MTALVVPSHYLHGKTRRKITKDENGVPRNQWGQPLIWQADGTLKPYGRISKMAKELDTGEGLKLWSNAMTAIGLAQSPELAGQVFDLVDLSADPYGEHKKDLIRLAGEAQEFAGSTIKRELGTTLHYWAEVVDRTGDLDLVPAEFRADIEAYLWATVELEVLASELFVVVDEVECAGTLDRLLRMPDQRVVVGDVKTGQNDCDYPMSVETQVAIYAHGVRYDFETGERTPLHENVDLNFGLLIHAPSGQATCELYPLDLVRGWKNALLAFEVTKARKESGTKLKPLTMGIAA
jgi:hypothetical protein